MYLFFLQLTFLIFSLNKIIFNCCYYTDCATTFAVNQDVDVLEGNNINISCTSVGGPTPTERWAFNNSSRFNHTDIFTHPQHGNVISGTIMSTLHYSQCTIPDK